MPVVHTVISRPKPGRQTEAINVAAQAAQLLRRNGAKDCRLLLANIAGEASGLHTFVSEYENNEDFGAVSEKLAVDPKLEALMEAATGVNSPVTIENQSLVAEVPLGRTGQSGRGSVIAVYISRLLPGQLQAGLDLARKGFDFVEGQGAMAPRLFVQSVAGSMTDLFVASFEFDSLRAWGKAQDAYLSPKGQKLAALLQAPDCPMVTVGSHLYQEIPI